MKATLAVAVVVALAASCSNRMPGVKHVHVAQLGYDMRDDWQKDIATQRGVVTTVWTPEENDHKESVTVIRTDRSPAVASRAGETLSHLLARAEHADASHVAPVFTPFGLAGARVDTTFTPPNVDATYHRVHAVLVDGTSLVHVLYTALEPDETLTVFTGVLQSIHHEES